MKQIVYRFLFMMLTMLFVSQVSAQDEMTIFVNESAEDAENVMTAYGSPLLRSLGTNFNSGWINTADVKSFGEFDVQFVATGSFAPADEQTFRPVDFGLDDPETSHIFTEEEVLPTIFGEMQDAQVTVFAENEEGTSFEAVGTYTIPTIEAGGAPLFMPHVSFGFVKGTEIMLRGLPPVDMPTYNGLEKLTTSYFAFGFKHDIKQWIPGLSKAPFSWAIFAAFSNANMTYDGPFLVPEDIKNDIVFAEGFEEEDYDQQKMEFDSKGYAIGTMISKKFPVVTLFGGFEYNSSTTSMALKGAYPYVNFDGDFENVFDTMSIEADQSNFGISAGMRFKLSIMSLTFAGMYVPDGYSSVTAAVGFGNFR